MPARLPRERSPDAEERAARKAAKKARKHAKTAAP
jgi:hypothetical protein